MSRHPFTPHAAPRSTALAAHLLCASLALCAIAAQAQPAAAPTAPSAAASPQRYAIPAGPLAAALNRLGRESGALITFAPALVAGLHTHGTQGAQGVAQALAALLAGTGLEAVPDASGAYALRRAPEAAPRSSSSGTATLAEVRVAATAVAQDGTTEGTGRYTAAGPSAAATGLALTLRETPQSVTVFTRQRMDDFKLQTLTDVMEQTPGLTVSRQSQGKIGSPIKLELFQKAMLEAAYGFVDDLDIRQYQEVLDVVGRKNGKTTLLSGINLYMLLGDGEGAPGAGPS